jgi:6-phosphogluconolactonase
VSIDQSGRFVMAANYNNGSIALLPIEQNGSLGNAIFTDQHQGHGPVPDRQNGPHAHMITQSANSFVYYTDLGLDQIFIYSLNSSKGTLQPTNSNVHTGPGTGPRHLAFHPVQPWAYVVGELNGTIECFSVNNSTGALTRFQVISTLPSGETKPAASADIHVTPDGKYLYASNRGDINNIAIYVIDQDTGTLRLLGHQSTKGRTPRNFAIDPSGKFLLVANQDSNNVVTFKIDPANGKLIDTGEKASIPNPVCLKFL